MARKVYASLIGSFSRARLGAGCTNCHGFGGQPVQESNKGLQKCNGCVCSTSVRRACFSTMILARGTAETRQSEQHGLFSPPILPVMVSENRQDRRTKGIIYVSQSCCSVRDRRACLDGIDRFCRSWLLFEPSRNGIRNDVQQCRFLCLRRKLFVARARGRLRLQRRKRWL